MQHTLHSTHELGKTIRSERRALGLTQSDLAGASGVSLRFISELERGRATAGFGRVLHVLHMLGLELILGTPDRS